ncbi:5-formyltetrahydrofolate cyclo-ligase [Actinobacteria bacterium IMCC25003]|nr:5-formyltetrahydrofolate cyclo-ligase [Actinobacteria bacterium IMCC25003]
MGISEEKSALRTRYRHERKERYIEHSFEFLATSPEFSQAKIIASYMSYGDEPDTQQLNQALIAAGKTLLLPRINGEGIDWVQWNGDADNLQKVKKILEPSDPVFTTLEKIEIVVVPALRIDRSGYRLGQGGGYYDRALPHLSAWSIGLIHPDEISSEDLPREPWDHPLHAAATSDLVLRFKKIH